MNSEIFNLAANFNSILFNVSSQGFSLKSRRQSLGLNINQPNKGLQMPTDGTNQPLGFRCSICTGFAIDSQVYLYGKYSRVPDYTSRQYFQTYRIEDSTGTISLTYKRADLFDSFNENYSIFLHVNTDFPKVELSCDVGFRNENNDCVDIDECKIRRHYCDLRTRSKLLIKRRQAQF